MKVLSTVCSLFLLGTIFSGVSMAMDEPSGQESRTTRKLLTIKGYDSSKDIQSALSTYALDCDALDVRVEGTIMDQVVGGAPDADPSDDVALLERFFSDIGKPRTYRHGVYHAEEAVIALAAHTRDSTQRSPRHVSITNTITASYMVEAIEKERGPMACSVLRILMLCPKVEDLNVRFFTVDPRGIRSLQEASRLSFLRELTIRYAHMNDDSVALLLNNPLSRLEHLDLAHNEITGTGFSEATVPSLISLDLWHNKIGDVGLQTITARLSSSLRTLSLGANVITEEGIRTARWSDKNLEILLLDCNPIKDNGALALADPEVLPTLRVLGLAYSEIGKDGLTALRARSSIKMIDVAGAQIAEDVKKTFRGGNLFLGNPINYHSHNGHVFTLREIAAKYPHIKFQ